MPEIVGGQLGGGYYNNTPQCVTPQEQLVLELYDNQVMWRPFAYYTAQFSLPGGYDELFKIGNLVVGSKPITDDYEQPYNYNHYREAVNVGLNFIAGPFEFKRSDGGDGLVDTDHQLIIVSADGGSGVRCGDDYGNQAPDNATNNLQFWSTSSNTSDEAIVTFFETVTGETFNNSGEIKNYFDTSSNNSWTNLKFDTIQTW